MSKINDLDGVPLYFKHLPYTDVGVSSAAVVADRILGRSKGGGFGVKAAFSVRIEPSVLHFVDVAATKAQTSRNDMINLILEAGIQAVLESMSDDERAAVLEQYSSTPFRGKLVSSEN